MKYIVISGVIILAIFLIVLSQIPLGIEPLTEVYFENHTSLPKYVFLNKDYNYSFTIHNLEYQNMKYEYVIDAFNESGEKMFEIDSGEVTLANNESKTFFKEVSMKNHFERAKINIEIKKNGVGEEPEFRKKLWWPDPNLENIVIDIHFWIEEITGPTITIIPD